MRPNLDRAVEPHENVLIGNFLYMLGLMIGARSGSNIPPGCVNLLQQTPNDKLIGDILAEFDGAVRVIEFKRSTADLSKEISKLTLLETCLATRPQLRSTSEEIHWYIETTKPTSVYINTRVRPYLHLQTPSHKAATVLLSFIRDFVADIFSDEPPDQAKRKLIKDYLDLLPKVNGSKTTSAGGLIVSASKEQGIQYLAARDFRELGLTLNALHKDYAQELSAQKQITHELELNKNGLSREITP